MSYARPVFEGDIVHIQRRTREGHDFLVPRRETLDLVRYAYAVAAERHGLILHAVCVMSTHVHVIATDPLGRHPDFTAFAHRVIALGLKRMYGIDGSVWMGGGPTVQRLVGNNAIVEALADLRVNPVAAGCVRDDANSQGVFGVAERAPLCCLNEEFVRPRCLGKDSTLPAAATFVLRAPETLVEELGIEGATDALVEAIRRHRKEAQAEISRTGKGYLGRRRVLAMDVWKKAKRLKRSRLRPLFKGVLGEAIRSAHEALRLFRAAYGIALAAFRRGETGVLFPPGTYLMRRRLGCATAVLPGRSTR